MSNPKDRKPHGLDALRDLREKLPPGRQQTPPEGQRVEGVPAGAAPATKGGVRRFSSEVNNASRAGRAPYNFIPLPDSTRFVAEPPPLDRYHDDFLSGTIDLEIEALTEFYVRGMWELEEFTSGGRSVKDQSEPFRVGKRLRLPGPSIRGMIRNLVEIIGDAPLDPVNDRQMFFRAVAATPNPEDRNSFEPHAVAYKRQIATVRAGYLTGSPTGWSIQPAKPVSGDRPGYRLRTEETWKRRQIHFAHDTIRAWPVSPGDRGAEEGWLICSGSIAKKHNQWVIPGPDGKAQSVDIPREDVEAYKEGGISQMLEEKGFDFTDRSKTVPCFWVEWQDRAGKKHIAFGHTPFFRLPYATTTAQAIPEGNRRVEGDNQWDLAQAIFGRVMTRTAGGPAPSTESKRGRVFFEDGIAPEETWHATRPAAVVLGEPKPTTFQHYAVQPGDTVEQSVHWDGDYKGLGKAVVRGHKMYWHRPGAPIRPADTKQSRVQTLMQVAPAGTRFQARVRYENLRPYELGALLVTLQLPRACAHRLGMGKPLGLGSFRLRIAALREISRKQRYARLFQEENNRLAQGDSNGNVVSRQDDYYSWYFDPTLRTRHTAEEFWKRPRMRELHAMLDFDKGPQQADWAGRTRYLEFGKLVAGPLAGKTYNEYQSIGYPPDRRMSKRRPLPPASQVWSGKNTPNDSRPQFEGPPLVKKLRSEPTKS
ncbi:MAG TPA: TIGR03986 family CRISPR-associated RAMP protein [Bryobacteraceae bacterium]|nr:TIGR03986 family CRISPR-associated RAMP protein [Bryobacteraceae bacterium]